MRTPPALAQNSVALAKPVYDQPGVAGWVTRFALTQLRFVPVVIGLRPSA